MKSALLFTFAASLQSAFAFPQGQQGSAAGIRTPHKRQAANATGPTVDLGYEVYQGVSNDTTGLTTFKGIRFAAPPTGQYRWQPPQAPASNRSNVIPATQYASRCPQSPDSPYLLNPCPDLQNEATLPDRCRNTMAFQRSIMGSEDCLFLNVYAPPDAKDLPVLVWIHGGGYGAGNGQQDLTSIINTNNKGFVGVAIQYRLGAFGFLSSDEVHRFGTVNAGILDQNFALQWVQSHIDKFGGDPRRVTIAGESAGGGSVMLQNMAYGGSLGTSLFQNSIVASPYLPMQYGYADWIPSQSYYAFAYQAGCFNGNPAFNESQTVLECLRGKDTEILQQVSAIVSGTTRFGTWGFLPVTDGTFIQDLPSRQLAENKVNGLRMLSGNNANEGPLFTPQDITDQPSFQAFMAETFPLFNGTDFANLYNTYMPSAATSDLLFATDGTDPPTALNESSFGVGYQQAADNIYAETTFVCPSYWLADSFASTSGPGRSAYKYQFSVPPAPHGSDVSGYFGPRAAYESPDFETAFMQIWGNFIISGNPAISNAVANGLSSYNFTGAANNTPNAASTWPEYTPDSPNMLNLNETGGTPATYTFNGTDSNPGMPPSNSTRFTIGSPYEVYNSTAGNGSANAGTSVTGNPVLRNDFTLVNAATWEGGRGARCDFWRAEGPRVPE